MTVTQPASPAQPSPAAPQVIYVTAPPQHRNGLGIGSFTCGLTASVIGMIPILGIPALAAALVGLGLGLGSIGRTRRHEASKAWTVLGIILSILGVILAIAGIVTVSKALNNLGSQAGSS